MHWKVMFGEVKLRDGENADGEKIKVLHSDQEVDLDDLLPEAFTAIAQDLNANPANLTDTGVYNVPVDSGETAYAVVVAAAKHLGIDPPPAPTRMSEVVAIKAMFAQAEDVAHQPMMGGFPPEQASGSDSSSTSPETTDGPETSPDPTL